MTQKMSTPPKGIRLIGLDLDGTTMNENKEITPRVRAAIQGAIAAGMVVLPATGRALETTTREILDIPGVRYAVTLNGARVYDLAEDRQIFEDCFTPQNAKVLLDICEDLGIMLAMSVNGHGYFSRIDVPAVARLYGSMETALLFQRRHEEAPDLQAILAAADSIDKFSLIFADMDLRERAKKIFADTGLCSVTASFSFNLELNTPTANKGAALVRLGQLLGIPRAAVMGIGDGTNDLPMMREVGYAVAMANGHPMVKNAAHHVTRSNQEDGVALAIEAVTAANGTL